MSKPWTVLAIVASLGATACKINGKAVGWPGGSSDGAGATASGGDGADDADAGDAGDDGADAPAVASVAKAGVTPAWCDADRLADATLYGFDVEEILVEDDAADAVYDLVGLLCVSKTTERRAELEAVFATWSKRLGMSDADWKDAVDWVVHPQVERHELSMQVDGKRPLSAMDAVEQYALIRSGFDDATYLADAFGPTLTAAGRMAYVEQCLRTEAVGAWVMCQADLLAFDAAAVSASLRTAKERTGYQRTAVRLAVAKLGPKIAERTAAIARLVDRDPAYGKLFAIAEQVAKTWSGRGKSDPALALALEMDDARRSNARSGFEGCADRTWDAFAAGVAAVPAQRFGELVSSSDRSFLERAVSIVLDDEDTYLAAHALIICGAGRGEAPDYLLRTLGEEMRYRPGYRGPRTATHTALLASGVTLDDRDAEIEYPYVQRSWIPGSTGHQGGGQGVVAATKASGGQVVVSFAKEMATYSECTKWKRTSRIDRIDASGNIYYEENCTKYTTRKFDRASEPQTVAARYATGVAKGSHVEIIEGVVTVVRAKQGGDPVAVFGVAVK